MAATDIVTSLQVLKKNNVLFLTLLAQKIASAITYSREEPLDIKATILPTLRPETRLSPKQILCSDLHPGHGTLSLRPTQNSAVAAGEADGAAYWSYLGEHTIHRFRTYYSPMSNL
jgi:hypothetical protein